MAVNLTRKELYDLVWAKPRSEIAKQFEISDVRLGKLCRQMNVPAPPRGYWANLAGSRRKRKYPKPPLMYNLAERIEEDHDAVWSSFPDFDPEKFDQPIPPPPIIPFSLEETLERYGLLVEQAPMPKATRELHAITQKLVTEDERLAKLAKQYSWEKPKFESPEGQKLLQGLNQLLWMWTNIGFKPSSSGSRNMRMWISRGGYGRSFDITCASSEHGWSGRPTKSRPTGFEFWFDTQAWERQSKKPDLIFPAFSRNILRSIALFTIEHWEKGFRESVTRQYDWKVAERKRAIEDAELALECDRKRMAAELQTVLDSRQKLLQDAISSAAQSNEIRSLVQALDDRITSRTEEVPAFEHWRSWVVSEAEAIDPRARSLAQLNEWLEKFGLDR